MLSKTLLNKRLSGATTLQSFKSVSKRTYLSMNKNIMLNGMRAAAMGSKYTSVTANK